MTVKSGDRNNDEVALYLPIEVNKLTPNLTEVVSKEIRPGTELGNLPIIDFITEKSYLFRRKLRIKI